MRPEDIFEAMTDISDEKIEIKPQKRKKWRRLAAMAAAIALVIGIVPQVIGGKGGSEGSGVPAEPGGATAFMSYAGPAFPLTAVEEGLSAKRELTWDFSPWIPVWYSIDDMMAELPDTLTDAERAEARTQYEKWYPEGGFNKASTDVVVTDKYQLDGEGKFTLVYPFVSSFYRFEADAPVMELNGSQVNYTVCADALSDGYSWGEPDGLYSWDDCKAVLDGGSLKASLTGESGIENTPVIVYRLENIVSPNESEENVNPTIELQFDMDYDKTQVLTYGFSGGTYDRESGRMGRNDSVGNERLRNDPRMLMVVGEDIKNLSIHGYKTGAVEAGNELEGISADIVREEGTLGEVMHECVEYYVLSTDGFDTKIHDPELFCSVAMRVIAEHGDYDRFFEGLGSLFANVRGSNRIFYAVAELDVVQGDTLELCYPKEASFDYHCANTKNKGVYGYDMVTRLGSTIDFTGQSAEIVNFESIKIVNQNMGFDLEGGITQVRLNLDTEHYYLEVRNK